MLLVPSSLHESPIHGVGVFCALGILQGETVWKFDDRVDFRRDDFPNWLSIFVCSDRNGNLLDGDNARFINHSDTPNLVANEDELIAARMIKSGEELTCDYRDHNSLCKLPSENNTLIPMKYDPTLADTMRLEPRLHNAVWEISNAMDVRGFEDWCYGPIASRDLVKKLQARIKELEKTVLSITR